MDQAKRRDRKIYITDDAIEKIGRVQLSDFSEEQTLLMQQRHEALLKIAKEQNDSNEVLMMCDLSFEKPIMVLGTQNHAEPNKNPYAVSLFSNSPPYSLVYMHNHPSTNNFSPGDISTFICDAPIKAMSVVTNQGEVYVLNKTFDYDYDKARSLLMDIFRSLHNETGKEEKLVRIFSKHCKKGGIEYEKR